MHIYISSVQSNEIKRTSFDIQADNSVNQELERKNSELMEKIARLESAYSQKQQETVMKTDETARLEGMLNTMMTRFEKLESSLATKDVPAKPVREPVQSSSVQKETVDKRNVPKENRNPEFAEHDQAESESDDDEEDFIQTANGDKVTLIDLY